MIISFKVFEFVKAQARRSIIPAYLFGASFCLITTVAFPGIQCWLPVSTVITKDVKPGW
jgi:hypothetical protein